MSSPLVLTICVLHASAASTLAPAASANKGSITQHIRRPARREHSGPPAAAGARGAVHAEGQRPRRRISPQLRCRSLDLPSEPPAPLSGAAVLMLGGRGGDQRKPARMAGLADRQRHGHPPDLIAQRPAWYRSWCKEYWAPTRAAPGPRRVRRGPAADRAALRRLDQHHVVDRPAMGAGDRPGSVEVSADQGQPAVQADPAAVEAGDGRPLAGHVSQAGQLRRAFRNVPPGSSIPAARDRAPGHACAHRHPATRGRTGPASGCPRSRGQLSPHTRPMLHRQQRLAPRGTIQPSRDVDRVAVQRRADRRDRRAFCQVDRSHRVRQAVDDDGQHQRWSRCPRPRTGRGLPSPSRSCRRPGANTRSVIVGLNGVVCLPFLRVELAFRLCAAERGYWPDRGIVLLPDEAPQLLPALQAQLGVDVAQVVPTALRLMNSSAAISWFDRPLPIRWATSVSRLVSARTDCFLAAGLAGRRQAASSSSVRAMNGAARSAV